MYVCVLGTIKTFHFQHSNFHCYSLPPTSSPPSCLAIAAVPPQSPLSILSHPFPPNYCSPFIQQSFNPPVIALHLRTHPSLQSASLLSRIFGLFILAMVVYFLVSIVHSMAQRYAKRLDEQEVHQLLHPECHKEHVQ